MSWTPPDEERDKIREAISRAIFFDSNENVVDDEDVETIIAAVWQSSPGPALAEALEKALRLIEWKTGRRFWDTDEEVEGIQEQARAALRRERGETS